MLVRMAASQEFLLENMMVFFPDTNTERDRERDTQKERHWNSFVSVYSCRWETQNIYVYGRSEKALSPSFYHLHKLCYVDMTRPIPSQPELRQLNRNSRETERRPHKPCSLCVLRERGP